MKDLNVTVSAEFLVVHQDLPPLTKVREVFAYISDVLILQVTTTA